MFFFFAGVGGDIFQTPVADSLPTLPFEVLRQLYDSSPLGTDDGRLLRRLSINLGVVHLLLVCLGIFTHQTQNNNQKENKTKDDRGQLYWAKGFVVVRDFFSVGFICVLFVCRYWFWYGLHAAELERGAGFDETEKRGRTRDCSFASAVQLH